MRNIYWPKHVDGSRESSLAPWIEAVRRATYIQELKQTEEKLLTALVDFGVVGDIPAAHAPLVPPVKSDADGRFRLAGIGREKVAEIIIDGPDLASSLILVATRPIEKPILVPAKPPSQKNVISNTWDDLTVFGHRVDHVAGPGRAVEGIVSDRATGKPLAGLVVHGPWRSPIEYHAYDRFQSTTDDQGRYRIEGLPVPSHGELTVDPPKDRPYLGTGGQIEVKAGLGPLKADISLRRGVWITGKVVDDATRCTGPRHHSVLRVL